MANQSEQVDPIITQRSSRRGSSELFHDFETRRPDGTTAWVRMAANKLLGAAVVSIETGPRKWSQASAMRMALEGVHQNFPNAKITSAVLVCYSYPKIGVKVEFEAPGKPAASEIFDASSGSLVQTSEATDHQFTAWSLHDALQKADIKERISRHDESTARLTQAVKATPELVRATITSQELQAFLPKFPISVSGLVWLSPVCHNTPGLTHYAQITNYNCVPASAQMILEHYGFNFPQSQIAQAMGTTAAQGGTSGSGLVNGLNALTNNCMVISFDDQSTRAQQLNDMFHEVNANRPLFTQVPHHYRVCLGYQQQLFFNSQPYLYIYDPWPWNVDPCQPGAPYYEAWNVSPVMWFGLYHHK